MVRCCIILILLLLVSTSGQLFLVTEYSDGSYAMEDCRDSAFCSLRSAWEACLNVSAKPSWCTIQISTNEPLMLNSTLGPLQLIPNCQIQISGTGHSEIVSDNLAADDFSSRFLYYDAIPGALFANSPSVSLYGIAVSGFGRTSANGGAVFLSGETYIWCENVTFAHNVGYMGGAVYISETTSGVIIFNSIFDSNQATYGGGLLFDYACQMVTIEDTMFTNNAAYMGAGLGLRSYNFYVTVARCTFQYGSGDYGGGLAAYYYSDYLTIADSTFQFNTVNIAGGGIFYEVDSYYLTIQRTAFRDCTGYYGGGLFINAGAAYIEVSDSTFENCRTTASHGGGMFIQDDSHDVAVRRCNFTSCFASHNGGSIYLSTSSVDVTIEDTIMVLGGAYQGGGLYAGVGNSRIALRRVQMLSCDATLGGGLYMDTNNQDVTIDDSLFFNCTSLYRGGAINIDANNDRMVITNSTLMESSSQYGGGLFSSRNHDLVIAHSRIANCHAVFRGGGVLLYDANAEILFLESVITNNTADTGAGIFAYPPTTQVTIAGCEITHNVAQTDGGGVMLGGGNAQFVITDALTATRMRTIESAHPYENPDTVGGYYTIVYETVQDAAASAFVVHFDEASEIGGKDYVQIYDQNFNEVFYINYDGYWPGRQLPPLRIAGATFYVVMTGYSDISAPPTAVSDGLYGFRLYAVPVLVEPGAPTIFEGNIARNGKGGGLIMFFDTTFSVISNAQFSRNLAETGGGAIALLFAIVGLTIENVLFEENRSLRDGGALNVESGCSGIHIRRCRFESNVAANSGGAASFIVGNGQYGVLSASASTVLTGCNLTDNHALYGGAVYLDRENNIEIHESDVTHNVATLAGGAIYSERSNYVYSSGSTMAFNTATTYGGAIAAAEENTVDLYATNLLNNHAGTYGGAICVQDGSGLYTYGLVDISHNTAEVVGGGIAIFDSPLLDIASDAFLYLSANTAQRGSALYLKGVETDDIALRNVYFGANIATVGGTVYWMYDDVMTDTPQGLPGNVSYNNVWWVPNEALYGEQVATQAVLVDGPTVFEVDSYAATLSPALDFALRDFYGQDMPIRGPTQLAAILANTSIKQCSGRRPFLAGLTAVELNGTVEFDALEANCAPAGSIPIDFEAQLLDLKETEETGEMTSYSIRSSVRLNFRSCERGEFIKDGRCVVCPAGSYSLEYPVTEETSCKDCTGTSGVIRCGGDVIEVGSGYWRRHNESIAVLNCLNDINGCAGGVSSGDALCDEGYGGPLCAVCEEGYYPSGELCVICGEKPLISPTVVVYLFILVAIIAWVVFFIYAKCLDTTGKGESAVDIDLTMDIENDASSEGDQKLSKRFKAWFQTKFKEVRSQLKIVITTYQIVSSIPGNLSVNFPGAFPTFLKAFSVFNLNVTAVIPFACSQTFTFIDKLIFTTLFPIILSVFLVLVCALDIVWQLRKGSLRDPEVRAKIQRSKDQYLTYFFFLTYLVLPSVSTTIFQIFLCTNVDPKGEDADPTDSFLIADMSISCTSDYYKRGVAYAAVMLLVYVFGIPAMYFALLYVNREELAHRDDAVVVMDAATQTFDDPYYEEAFFESEGPSAVPQADATRVLSPKVERLAFLWDAYEPQFWYWEVVETTRRLMLTAVLSVCGAGTSAQSIFAVLLALMYIKLYGFYEPYESDADDVIAETGQFQIFFSFLGALIYQRSLLGSEWNDFVSTLLIIVNVAVTGLFIYFGYVILQEEFVEADIAQHHETYGEKGFAEAPAYMLQTESYAALSGVQKPPPGDVYIELSKMPEETKEDPASTVSVTKPTISAPAAAEATSFHPSRADQAPDEILMPHVVLNLPMDNDFED